MSKPSYANLAVVCVLGLATLPCLAQQTPVSAAPAPAAQTPASPGQQDPSTTPAQPPAQPDTQTPVPPNTPKVIQKQLPPPVEPGVIEDGGYSIEPMYWLSRGTMYLKGGAQSSGITGLNFPGHSKASYGAEISIPAGKQNTLRVTYFRTQGTGSTTATRATNIFSEGYAVGDYLTTAYTMQAAKISWDYLSYTWYRPGGAKIRMKTLYELQYVNIGSTVAAPLKAETADSSGNVDDNVATGSKNVILPTFGVEFEQTIANRFRWQVKGSGFGLPNRADIWDADASIAYRVGSYEVIVGARDWHVKTSPKGDFYFAESLPGAYVGLRWYWTRTR